MHWSGPILTDSGGFQVFSLAKLAKISEDGYAFQSHIDGSRHLFTPEKAVAIQDRLNSDIHMCLDQCLPYPSDRAADIKALELTHRWAKRCKTHGKTKPISATIFLGLSRAACFRICGNSGRTDGGNRFSRICHRRPERGRAQRLDDGDGRRHPAPAAR